jgi:hypothetical protein
MAQLLTLNCDLDLGVKSLEIFTVNKILTKISRNNILLADEKKY